MFALRAFAFRTRASVYNIFQVLGPSCVTCAFVDFTVTLCRRLPPNWTLQQAGPSWPITVGTAWCGEYVVHP